MDTIDQHTVNELARELEPLAVDAWPARATSVLDGWLLRFSEGYSSRSNSVSTLEFGGTLDAAIATVEVAYRARGLVPQFQISPASRPKALEQALIARGYEHKPTTIVMVANASAIAATRFAGDIRNEPDVDFIRLTLEGSHSPEDGRERLATLARVQFPTAYVSLGTNGETASCGACVVTADWAGVYVMRTAAAHRRKGFGRQVLQGIAGWALTQGASRLYLQVDEENISGRALYTRTGFQDGYYYRHYYAPLP